jgi:hypothetical protein
MAALAQTLAAGNTVVFDQPNKRRWYHGMDLIKMCFRRDEACGKWLWY